MNSFHKLRRLFAIANRTAHGLILFVLGALTFCLMSVWAYLGISVRLGANCLGPFCGLEICVAHVGVTHAPDYQLFWARGIGHTYSATLTLSVDRIFSQEVDSLYFSFEKGAQEELLPYWTFFENGFCLRHEVLGDSNKQTPTEDSEDSIAYMVGVPLWIALPAIGAWPFLSFVRGPLRRRRRRRRGLCIGCGYDLRGNLSGVCSECGLAATDRQLDK